MEKELETEFEKKFGGGKAKIGLVVCAVLVVILAVSNLWFFLMVNDLETEKNSLQSQMSGLQTDKNNLQSQVDSLGTWLDGNKTSLGELEEKYCTLNVTYGMLYSDFASLQSDYSLLESDYANLEGDYGTLETDYENLNLEYYELEGNYTYLSTQYEILDLKYFLLEYDYDLLSVFADRPLESKSTPSLSELQNWLFLDQTNLLGYHNDFDCKDFSVVLSVKARTHHWDMGVIAVYGYDADTEEDYAHAFNFIVTTDGLVYVEPQTDDVWWYTDYEEIKPEITWEIGEDQWITVEDVEIVFEGS